ncbi:TPA: hypothetical protein ACWYGP_003430 [Raoultella planticola]
MAPVLDQSYSVFGCGRGYQLYVLGCEMSKNGIRSLVIALAIGIVFWVGLAIEIKGALNG